MEQTPGQVARAEAAKQAVILLFMILGVLFVMAVQKPDFLRTLRMQLAAASSKLLTYTSRKAGHISMGIELTTGARKYTVPYRLSKIRDKMQERYQKECDQLCQYAEPLLPGTAARLLSWSKPIKHLRASGSGAPGVIAISTVSLTCSSSSTRRSRVIPVS
jgi:hypothetical protein